MPNILIDLFAKTFIEFVRVNWDTALWLRCTASFRFYLMQRCSSVAS